MAINKNMHINDMVIEEEDLSTNANIFGSINLIEGICKDNIIPIFIDNNVNFVSPLFLILILQYQNRTKKNLVIDVINAKSSVQQHFHIFLQQYKHLKTITFHHSTTKEKIGKRTEEIVKTFENQKNTINGEIHFYSSEFHKEYIGFCKGDYHFLPIIKLTRSIDEYEYNELQYVEDMPNECMNFYKNMSIGLNKEKYQSSLENGIENIINGIMKNVEDTKGDDRLIDRHYKENLKQLKGDFEDIIFELIDNIQKHTEKNSRLANGYISSRIVNHGNRDKSIYEFIISDDYENGLIESFKQTLINDRNNLSPAVKKITEIVESYNRGIAKINAHNEAEDLIVLNGLFRIEDSFGLREIQRLTVHFGIPTLIKLLKRLGGILNIYVHHEYRYYHIYFDANSNKAPIVKSITEGVQGTHIYISFPNSGLDEYLKRPYVGNVSHKLELENKKIHKIFEDRDGIQKKMDLFKYFTLDNIRNKTFKVGTEKHIIIRYDEENYGTVSDFFRMIYAFSLFHDTKDIYVYNFPTRVYKNHLIIIAETVLEEKVNIKVSLPNIIIQDKSSFNITFFGGKDISYLKKINSLIAKVYNQDKREMFENLIETDQEIDEKDITVESDMFYKKYESDHFMVLPFLLLGKYDNRPFLSGVIKEYLADAKSIHVNTGHGYHIDKFYDFKSIYEDSQWVNRIAFELALEIMSVLKHQILNKDTKTAFRETKKLILVGTDRYSRLILSLAKSFLSNKKGKIEIKYKESLKEKAFEIDVENHIITKKSSMRIEALKKEEKYRFIVYSSVVYSEEYINETLVENNNFKDKCLSWFKAIKISITTGGNSIKEDKKALVNITLKEGEEVFAVDTQHSCSICTNYDKPLYQLREDDPFAIDYIYLDKYTEKFQRTEKSIQPVLVSNVKWYNSIYFGHTVRGLNHYTYYTKTEDFFNNNKLDTKNNNKNKIFFFLESIKKIIEGKEKDSPKGKDIILSPLDSTNNDFVSFVDQVVFSNDATIYRYDRSKAEANFYALNGMKINDDDKIYFVDDEISSGNTIGYFYSLLRAKEPLRSFDGAIFMIDRMSAQDEKMLCNFIKCNPKYAEDREECFADRMGRVYTFTKLEIRPIKTELESCFFCDKQKMYIKMMSQIALDMDRYQIAKRIIDLNTKKYYDIDNQDIDSKLIVLENIKTYIKMYAVNYVYEKFDNFERFSNIEEESEFMNQFIKLEDELKEKILKILSTTVIQRGNVTQLHANTILNFQTEIALQKALAYPKLVYFVSIRKIITKVVKYRIKKHISNKNCMNFIVKGELPDRTVQWVKEEYKNKIELDRLNTLYIIAAHLNLNSILRLENITHYYEIVQEVKKRKLNDELLHSYPFATNLVCQQGIGRARYFENELKSFNKTKKLSEKRYSLINALFLENNYLINKEVKENNKSNEFAVFCDRLIKSESNIGNKIEKFSTAINAIVNDLTVELASKPSNLKYKLEHIFINENMNYDYHDNYSKYLEKTNLKDIMHGFHDVNLEKHQIVDSVYRGHRSKKDENHTNNTWANKFEKILIEEEEKCCTIVRLVHVDTDKLVDNRSITRENLRSNKPIWSKPIGCIVVSHNNGVYREHLRVAKILLAIQSKIVNFFREELGGEAFKESIQNKKHEIFYDKFMHGQGSLFQMEKYIKKVKNDYKDEINPKKKHAFSTDLRILEDFSIGVTNISLLIQLREKKLNKVRGKPYNFMDLIFQYKKRIETFLYKANKKDSDTYKQVEIEKIGNVFFIPMKADILLYILYEISFNASKYGQLEMNEKVKLTIRIQNNILIIENKIRNPRETSDKLGISKIEKIFSAVDFKFKPQTKGNKQYIIKIFEEKK